MNYYQLQRLDELYHYGTKGMHWYERKYQNPDGSLTPAGRERYGVGKSNKSNKEDLIRSAYASSGIPLTGESSGKKHDDILKNDSSNPKYVEKHTKILKNGSYEYVEKKNTGMADGWDVDISGYDLFKHDEKPDKKRFAQKLSELSKAFDKEAFKEQICVNFYDNDKYSDWITDESGNSISRDELKKSIKLDMVYVEMDRETRETSYSVCYDDGGLFGGHILVQTATVEDGKIKYGNNTLWG